jgi:hypothetical protein
VKFFSRVLIPSSGSPFRKTQTLFYSNDDKIPVTSIDSLGLQAYGAAIITRPEQCPVERFPWTLQVFLLIPLRREISGLLKEAKNIFEQFNICLKRNTYTRQ